MGAGRHVILLGDPAQLPAVSRKDVFGTTLWIQFSVLLLREVKQALDPTLASLLAKVRLGSYDQQLDSMLHTCVSGESWDSVDFDTTMIYSRRDECSEINDHCIECLEGCSCE